MNLDFSELPFEIWCDLVEESGVETASLRTVFALVQIATVDRFDHIGSGLPDHHVRRFGNGLIFPPGDDHGDCTRCEDVFGDGFSLEHELEDLEGF